MCLIFLQSFQQSYKEGQNSYACIADEEVKLRELGLPKA